MRHNIRVCIMSSVHKALDTRIFYKEAKTLIKCGFRVTLIAQHPKDEILEGVKIIALEKSRNRILRIFISPLRILIFCILEQAHIYHLHDPELLPLGMALKVLTNAKVIYDIHENIPKQILDKQWIPFCLRAIIGKIAFLFDNMSVLFLDAIFVAGEDIAEHLPRSKKAVLLRNYPLLEIVRKNERKRSTDGSQVLIYAGSLTRDRGIQEMVEMIEFVKSNAELVLVGSFPDGRFEKQIKKKAKNQVKFVGQVAYKEVFCYLDNASIGLILLHPVANNITAFSRNNKIFEYMAMGLPIIASNFPCWKKEIEDSGYGITADPLDPREISRAVCYLLAHPEKARKMGEKGRKAILQKYNWEKEAEMLIGSYRNLIG